MCRRRDSNPLGSELSALEYLLEGHETMPPERGLFLGETWRLHPTICSYTSELFYEQKLKPHPGLAAQVISGPTPYAGSGRSTRPCPMTGIRTDRRKRPSASPRS